MKGLRRTTKKKKKKHFHHPIPEIYNLPDSKVENAKISPLDFPWDTSLKLWLRHIWFPSSSICGSGSTGNSHPLAQSGREVNGQATQRKMKLVTVISFRITGMGRYPYLHANCCLPLCCYQNVSAVWFPPAVISPKQTQSTVVVYTVTLFKDAARCDRLPRPIIWRSHFSYKSKLSLMVGKWTLTNYYA